MALPITVPYTFGNATTAIPLSNLDSDYATVYQAVNGIGNGSVALANVAITGGTISGNTTASNVTVSSGTFTNVTLSNVTISSVSTPITAAEGGTGSSSAFTTNGVVYASSTSALATGSALTFDGTTLTSGRFAANSAGYVTNPAAPLFGVYGGNGYVQAPSGGNIQLWSADTTAIIIADKSQTIFQAAGSEQMRLNSTGLGLGTSSPLSLGPGYTTLTINNATNGGGVVFATGGVDKGQIFNGGNAMYLDCANSAGVINFRNTATGATMQFGSAGIVTMSAYGAGAATFSASGVISSVSDETWKTKDGAPSNPDEMLQKLEPGYWYYNEEKRDIFGTDRHLGFYAQNVNNAIGPEAAPQPEEGKPWGYYDRSVLAVVVMSLQKALETIESLTARLTALENK